MENESTKDEPSSDINKGILTPAEPPMSTFLHQEATGEDSWTPVDRKRKPPQTDHQQFIDIDSRQVKFYGDHGEKSFLPDDKSPEVQPKASHNGSPKFPNSVNYEVVYYKGNPSFSEDKFLLNEKVPTCQSIANTSNDVDCEVGERVDHIQSQISRIDDSQNQEITGDSTSPSSRKSLEGCCESSFVYKPDVSSESVGEEIEEAHYEPIKAIITAPYTILASNYDKEIPDGNESNIIFERNEYAEIPQLHSIEDYEEPYKSKSHQTSFNNEFHSPYNLNNNVDESCDSVNISFRSYQKDDNIGIANPYFEEGSFEVISTIDGEPNLNETNMNSNNNNNNNNNDAVLVPSQRIFYGEYKDTNNQSFLQAPNQQQQQQKKESPDSKSLGRTSKRCIAFVLICLLIVIPVIVVVLMKVKSDAMKQGKCLMFQKYVYFNKMFNSVICI